MLLRVVRAKEEQTQALIGQARAEVERAQQDLEEANALCAAYDLRRFDKGVSAQTMVRNQRFLQRVQLLRDTRLDELSRARNRVAELLKQWRGINQTKHMFGEAKSRVVRVETAEKKRKLRRSANSMGGTDPTDWSMLKSKEDLAGQ